jgi:hypothetical protein
MPLPTRVASLALVLDMSSAVASLSAAVVMILVAADQRLGVDDDERGHHGHGGQGKEAATNHATYIDSNEETV